MVDLSSSLDEEDLIPDTSWDEEFTKKIFSDLNRDVLGPPDDGNIIILTDSDEEEDVRKEDVTNIEVMPSSTARILASTTSTADTDEAPRGVQDDNSGNRTPDSEADGGSNGGDEADSP
jgi:hypothetical protein